MKTKIVCFCGSTRFAEYFMVERWKLEKQGIITLGINILPDNYFAEGNAHGAEQEGVKHILDELHKRKIDISDEVFILNVGGYIGESTRNELNYAMSIGKPVKYLETIEIKTGNIYLPPSVYFDAMKPDQPSNAVVSDLINYSDSTDKESDISIIPATQFIHGTVITKDVFGDNKGNLWVKDDPKGE